MKVASNWGTPRDAGPAVAGRFDGAFCVGNSFGYLDDQGNAAFLRAVWAALKPGGRLVVETPMIPAEPWTRTAHSVTFVAARR